jgi:hypothetical protein
LGDHRPPRTRTFEGGDLVAYIRSAWDAAPDFKIYIEAVHRLSNAGAVVTHVAYGTSPEGLDAEWRMIELLAVGRDPINRCELYDEADLDAALARFDELDRQAPLVGNAATRTGARVADAFNRRDVDGLVAPGTDRGRYEDRRKGALVVRIALR